MTAPSVGDAVVMYAADECPDGPETVAYGPGVLTAASVTTPTCTQSALQAAIDAAHLATSDGYVGVVDISECEIDLDRTLLLRSRVVVWGPGATLTTTSGFVSLWSLYRDVAVYGADVHDVGIVGVTITGGPMYGILLVDGSSDIMIHDVHTSHLAYGVYLGEARHRAPEGELWPYLATEPLTRSVRITCSSFSGGGRVPGSIDSYGCTPRASSRYGTGIAAADLTGDIAISSTRTECNASHGINIHAVGVDIDGWASKHDATNKFPGVERLRLRGSSVIDPIPPVGWTRTTALALDRSEPWTPYPGESYTRYVHDVDIDGMTFSFLGNDLAMTSHGGSSVRWGASSYTGYGRYDGSVTAILPAIAYPWSDWTVVCSIWSAGVHHCHQPGGLLYVGPDVGFSFSVEAP